MKEIANLSRIATSRRLSSFPLLDLSAESPGKEGQLVAALVRAPGLTQHQLVREIYGSTSASHMAAFRKLRSRVQAKLLNHLYFLDHSDPRLIVTRRYEMELMDLFHQVTVLQAEGEYLLAERLLRKCLRLAQLGEFTQYTLRVCQLLRTSYVLRQQPARYRVIIKLLAKTQQLLAWEEEAERVYMEVRLAVTGTVAARRALLPKMGKYLSLLEELNRKARTYLTYDVLYHVRLLNEEFTGNYTEIIRITAEADKKLQQGKLNVRRFDKRFNNYMSVYGYLQSRQPVQGLKLAEGYLQNFHPSSNNWFSFQENHFLLAVHAEQYEKASRVMQAVFGNPFYPKQRVAAQQRWDLFRAYMEFMRPAQKTVARPQLVAQWALTLPDFSRDKRGHNVAILILQVLYYLRLRDLDAVLLRLERLRKYQQRHLRDGDTLRSRLFIRLLLLIIDKDFDPVACAERGQNILKKLQEAPQPGEAYAEIEVVPYENLWALTLQILKDGPPQVVLPKAT
jgi:hypothetical protein